jgi:hypothetical protein
MRLTNALGIIRVVSAPMVCAGESITDAQSLIARAENSIPGVTSLWKKNAGLVPDCTSHTPQGSGAWIATVEYGWKTS